MTLIKTHYHALIIVFIMGLVMSRGLLDIPKGLTVDEAAFGLNATILADTGRDENGRFLPVFVLSIGGKDWRQPVTQYYQALFFKLFGSSVYNLRLSSLIITLATALVIYALIYEFSAQKWLALVGELLYLTTPIVYIQSHMGLDNNLPVLFSAVFLFCLGRLVRSKKIYQAYLLITMAVSLGLAFYAYKGMRVVVPSWGLVIGLYLWIKYKRLKPAIIFGLWLAPFFIVIPFLNYLYPGAILGGTSPNYDGIYNFIYPYLSYFDPSFLFVTGDATVFHSTGKHGMLLLSTLPLVVLGLISFIQKKHWIYLILLATAPLLMGTVGSVHRASRLMAVLPIFLLLMTAGLTFLNQRIFGRLFTIILLFLTLLNFLDFRQYYQDDYAKVTEESFGNLQYYQAFARLQHTAGASGQEVYISKDAADASGESGRFFQQIYFHRFLPQITREEDYQNIIVLSLREKIDNYENLGCDGQRMRLCVQQSK